MPIYSLAIVAPLAVVLFVVAFDFFFFKKVVNVVYYVWTILATVITSLIFYLAANVVIFQNEINDLSYVTGVILFGFSSGFLYIAMTLLVLSCIRAYLTVSDFFKTWLTFGVIGFVMLVFYLWINLTILLNQGVFVANSQGSIWGFWFLTMVYVVILLVTFSLLVRLHLASRLPAFLAKVKKQVKRAQTSLISGLFKPFNKPKQ